MSTEPDKISHLRRAIEFFSIIINREDYIKSDDILADFEKYQEDTLENDPIIRRYLKTIENYIGKEVIESKPNVGYCLKKIYRDNLDWLQPILSKYLSLVELDSLNYPVEAILYHLKTKSLYNLYKLKEARNRQKTIEFEYVNYGRTEVKQKVINVYSIILRGRKLFIIGFDTIKKEVRHYVFNQIKSVGEIYEDSSFELPPKEELSKFYRDSLVSFEGPEPRRVVIRFEKAAEIYVKQDFFHQSQRFYDKNSSLYLEMYINNEYELFTMLGKYLDSSELIEPADWKEEYIKKLKTALFLNKI